MNANDSVATNRNWLNHMRWQLEFAQHHRSRPRTDGERDWPRYERAMNYRERSLVRRLRPILKKLGRPGHRTMTPEWLELNADRLWATRRMFADDLSRLLFDQSLVLRLTNHRQFYFPRIDFDDLADVEDVTAFAESSLPSDYLGLPLKICALTLRMPDARPVALRVVCTAELVSGLNSYRQYLTTREGRNISPRSGETVLDCGACIGDFSTLFAGMVGARGEVHAFDPIPLHNRYCAIQSRLNPELAAVLHFNPLAVGAYTSKATRPIADSQRIDPSHRMDDGAFDCTTLDDYCAEHTQRVDFIKMDIEGAEMDALAGAANVISTYKPRLAISGYHKPADLWEIPQKLKALNPDYTLTFGHHSPVRWESVFYASDPGQRSPATA